MRRGSTDFYLNLDRWEDLSTIERQRGAWEARLSALATRVEPMRREATFQAGWSLFFPGKAPDSKAKDRVLGPTPPEGKNPAYVKAWRYCRAVQFVDGWHQRFAWNAVGADQLLRLLTDPREAIASALVASFLAVHVEAMERTRGLGGIPILDLSAYLGVGDRTDSLEGTQTQLYLLGLRTLLLQRGYQQILVSPIEPPWLGRARELALRTKASPPAASPEGTEALLGIWLDDLASLLLSVGKEAEEAWSCAQSLAPRSGLQEAILTLALQHGRVSAGEIIRATSANRNTVKDNLARLVQEGILRKQGQKRGTIYTPV